MNEYVKVAFFGFIWLWCGVTTLLAYLYVKDQQTIRCVVCGGKTNFDEPICDDCRISELLDV